MGFQMSRRYLTSTRLRELDTALTERDFLILRYVIGLRFLSGDQLTRLCFVADADPAANARAARRTLLRLVRLEVLMRLPRSVGGARAGSAGFVYCLGLAGHRLSELRGWQPKRRRRRSHSPGHLFLRHALSVTELHVFLIEGDRSRRFELLELSPEPSCWRSYDGTLGQRATLKPDSFVRLGLGPYEDSYFVEVDRGTEGSRALEGKMQAYAAYHRSGREQASRDVFPKVLWLATSQRRIAAIADVASRQSREARPLFAVASFNDALAVMTADT